MNLGISESWFVILTLVKRYSEVCPKFSLALRRVPNLPTITLMVLQCQILEIPVTPKASQNVLLGSDALLNLMLLRLHRTSSQTLQQAPSYYKGVC